MNHDVSLAILLSTQDAQLYLTYTPHPPRLYSSAHDDHIVKMFAMIHFYISRPIRNFVNAKSTF